MSRDAGADALWDEVHPVLTEDREGMVGAVLRLSLLYALLDGQRTVRADHLRSALALWAYVEYIFGDAMGDPLTDRLADVLVQNGDLSRSQISAMLNGKVPSARLDAALRCLAGAGRATVRLETTRGRPLEIWSTLR